MYQAAVKISSVYRDLDQPSMTVQYLKKAIDIKPNDPSSYVYLGDTLNNLKRWEDAVTAYKRAVSIAPTYGQAHLHMADTLSNLNRLEESVEHYKIALDLGKSHGPPPTEVLVGYLRALTDLALWEEDRNTGRSYSALVTQVIQKSVAEVKRGKPSPLSPYGALFYPVTPADSLLLAQSHSTRLVDGAREAAGYTTPFYHMHSKENSRTADTDAKEGGWSGFSYKGQAKAKKMRIGYISRRFEKYPGTQLMLRVFKLHDRSQFEVYCYAHGADDGSDERKVVKEDADVFADVSALTGPAVARRIAEDNVDILVDYDGLHSFNNLAVLALRPAPVQVTYLGFAGTTGAPRDVLDYIITDPIISPPSFQKYFSEELLPLPHMYQPQDHMQLQKVDFSKHSKKEEGLPEKGVVFACFNRAHKIDPEVFGAWMRILERVPGSVIWLYVDNASVRENLLATASSAGVDKNRVVFGRKVPKSDHLGRLALADLTLDTFYYGAHTTCSDSLWVGVPVLTRPSQGFASRVAASLVTAAGLGNDGLVVDTTEEYVARAVELGSDPGLNSLVRLRKKLASGQAGIPGKDRSKAPFFDTPRYVQDLEKAYRTIYEKHVQQQKAPGASAFNAKEEL
mmetsp:Transcript_47351/g.93140  ORF Transcript_47351/g.93140 Transcript_47351/m.93140 type:complete len:624 (-) Transcript_47351:204-2075(-)